jgi:hypothetical protein
MEIIKRTWIVGEHIYKIVSTSKEEGRCVKCAAREFCGACGRPDRLDCKCNIYQHYIIDVKEERKLKLKKLNEK